MVALTSRLEHSSFDHLPFLHVFRHLTCVCVCVFAFRLECGHHVPASLTASSSALSHGITMRPPPAGAFTPALSCDQVLSDYTRTEKTHFKVKCRERETTSLLPDSRPDLFSNPLFIDVISASTVRDLGPPCPGAYTHVSVTHSHPPPGHPRPLGSEQENLLLNCTRSV